MRAPTLCAEDGCGELVTRGRCPKHEREHKDKRNLRYRRTDTHVERTETHWRMIRAPGIWRSTTRASTRAATRWRPTCTTRSTGRTAARRRSTTSKRCATATTRKSRPNDRCGSCRGIHDERHHPAQSRPRARPATLRREERRLGWRGAAVALNDDRQGVHFLSSRRGVTNAYTCRRIPIDALDTTSDHERRGAVDIAARSLRTPERAPQGQARPDGPAEDAVPQRELACSDDPCVGGLG